MANKYRPRIIDIELSTRLKSIGAIVLRAQNGVVSPQLRSTIAIVLFLWMTSQAFTIHDICRG